MGTGTNIQPRSSLLSSLVSSATSSSLSKELDIGGAELAAQLSAATAGAEATATAVAPHDAEGGTTLFIAASADFLILRWCSGDTLFGKAGDVGSAAAAASEIVMSLCRGLSSKVARDGVSNGVLAAAEAADWVAFVRSSGEARSKTAGAVGFVAAAASESVFSLGLGR